MCNVSIDIAACCLWIFWAKVKNFALLIFRFSFFYSMLRCYSPGLCYPIFMKISCLKQKFVTDYKQSDLLKGDHICNLLFSLIKATDLQLMLLKHKMLRIMSLETILEFIILGYKKLLQTSYSPLYFCLCSHMWNLLNICPTLSTPIGLGRIRL